MAFAMPNFKPHIIPGYTYIFLQYIDIYFDSNQLTSLLTLSSQLCASLENISPPPSTLLRVLIPCFQGSVSLFFGFFFVAKGS